MPPGWLAHDPHGVILAQYVLAPAAPSLRPLPPAACGNASPSLTFRTRHSGELTVRRSSSAAAAAGGKAADGKAATGPLQLELSLPRYEPADAVPSCAVDPTGPLILACTGGLPVFEVLFAGQGLNYLLVVLAEGTSREQLEGVVPDKAAMLAACPQGGQLSGVIVSACGGGGWGRRVSGPGGGGMWCGACRMVCVCGRVCGVGGGEMGGGKNVDPGCKG